MQSEHVIDWLRVCRSLHVLRPDPAAIKRPSPSAAGACAAPANGSEREKAWRICHWRRA